MTGPSAVPQYCGSGYVQELRAPARRVKLSDSQKLRLDMAYAQLQESGQKITVQGYAQSQERVSEFLQ